MLNITDVKKRLEINPEPKEVGEIRGKIISTFNRLEFIEEGHKYFLHNDDGSTSELKSVSETIHQFVPYVDWDEKAHGCALKEGVDVSVIKRRWEENNLRATNNGTSTHLFAEHYHWFVTDQIDKISSILQPQYEKGYFIPYGEKQNAVQQYNEDLFNVEDMYPLMVETQVYTNKYAGTFDKLIYYKHPTDNNKSGLIISDYKTNASLSSDYNRKFNVTMLPPFDDLIDEALSHYTLQLSMYQIPLEDIGLKVLARRLIWLKSDGTYEQIALPDITKKIRKTLEL